MITPKDVKTQNTETRYAVLGEKSAACQMSSMSRFESVLETGRELLYGDRVDVLDFLEKRYDAGLLTDVEYEIELLHIFEWYNRLLKELTQIVNKRREKYCTELRKFLTY